MYVESIILVTFLARPKKGNAKEGRPAKILYGMLNRPRYISETRLRLRHPKCLTLGLNRLPKFSHGVVSRSFRPYPKPRTSLEWSYVNSGAHVLA